MKNRSLLNTRIFCVYFIDLSSYPEKKGYPIIDLLRYIFEVIKEPEVKRELLGNIYISLFICGICIVINTISSLKATKKIKVKELDK